MHVESEPHPWHHPGDVLRVFVGATSGDLRRFRVRARDVLEETGRFYADIQEVRPPDFRDIPALLRAHIEMADAVICLVGVVYGAEPPGSEHLGEKRRSYTQLELDIAASIPHLPVFRFLASETADFDTFHPEPPELQVLQRNFRAEVQGSVLQYTSFSTQYEMERHISNALIMRIDALWEARGTRRGWRPGSATSSAPPHPFAPPPGDATPHSSDAWKEAVGLVICGEGPGAHAIGTAFCLKKGFLISSASVVRNVEFARAANIPCFIRWETHSRRVRESLIDKVWPDCILRIESHSAPDLALVAQPDAALTTEPPSARVTTLCATAAPLAGAHGPVQIERIRGLCLSSDDRTLRVRSVPPALAGAMLSGAPLLSASGHVAAVVETVSPKEGSDELELVAIGVDQLRQKYPSVFATA